MDTSTPQRSEIEREERAWHLARIHRSAHGYWFAEDCPVCLGEAEERERLIRDDVLTANEGRDE